MHLRFAFCLHLLLVANWGFAQDDEARVAATPVLAASNPLDSDTVFADYAFSLFLSGATLGEMQTFETYAQFLHADPELAQDPFLLESAYDEFLVAFMLEKSEGSETKPDKKTFPPGSTGTDRTPTQGDVEDKRAAEREKRVGDIIDDDYQIERQPKVSPAHEEKYPGAKPDLKINGDYFDVYSPKTSTSPRNIAATVDKKVGEQAGRIVLDLQIDFTEGQIRDVLDAIQGRRDTPDTATREKLEELWVVMPDGSIRKLFPGVIK
jgi:hypothetical protein